MSQTFAKSHRLLKTDDFSSVFVLRRRLFLDVLAVWYADNGLSHPRLGLVVSKKCDRRAVARNTMKRLLREWFRRNRLDLPAKDFVLCARRAFGREDFPRLESQLRRLRHLTR